MDPSWPWAAFSPASRRANRSRIFVCKHIRSAKPAESPRDNLVITSCWYMLKQGETTPTGCVENKPVNTQ
jgi:hypothetical protein